MLELRLDIRVVVLELIAKEGKAVGIKGVEGPALGVGCTNGGDEDVSGNGGTIVDDAAAGGSVFPGLSSVVVAAASLYVWLVAAAEEFDVSVTR